jgi:hypothetical protein
MVLGNTPTITITTLALNAPQMGIDVLLLLRDVVAINLGFGFGERKHREGEVRDRGCLDGQVELEPVGSVDTGKVVAERSLGGIPSLLEALQILAQNASSERSAEKRRARINEAHTDQMPAREENHAPDGTVIHHLGAVPSLLTGEFIREGTVDFQLLEPLLQ